MSIVFLDTANTHLKGKFALGGYIDGVLSVWHTDPLYSKVKLTQVFSSSQTDDILSPVFFYKPRYSNIPIIDNWNYYWDDNLIISDDIDGLRRRYDFLNDIVIGNQITNGVSVVKSIGEFVPIQFK